MKRRTAVIVLAIASRAALGSISGQYSSLCSLAGGFTNLADLRTQGLSGWDCSGGGGSNICAGVVWTGITCNRAGDIVSIDLTGLGVQGTISPLAGNLSSTYSMNLNGNSLTGSIPPQLSSMTSLQSLDLSDNLLSGTVPSSLCGIPSLSTLLLCGTTGCGSLGGCIPACLSSSVLLAGFGSLPVCSPTPSSTPTTMPSDSSSSAPTDSSSSDSGFPTTYLIIIVVLGSACCLAMAAACICFLLSGSSPGPVRGKTAIRVSDTGIIERRSAGVFTGLGEAKLRKVRAKPQEAGTEKWNF